MDTSNLVDGPHERYDGGPANPDVGSMTASHPESCYQGPYACRIQLLYTLNHHAPLERPRLPEMHILLNQKFAGASTIHSDTLGSRRQSP